MVIVRGGGDKQVASYSTNARVKILLGLDNYYNVVTDHNFFPRWKLYIIYYSRTSQLKAYGT